MPKRGNEVVFQGQEVYTVQIELLIKILALQKTTIVTLIELMDKPDAEKDKIMASISEDATNQAREILDNLFARRGKINLNDILGSK